MSKTIWVCQTNSAHVFDKPTNDFFCPVCPPLEGILLEVVDNQESAAAGPVIDKTIWVCLRNSAHVFSEPTDDFFCPMCPPFESILREVVDNQESVAAGPVIDKPKNEKGEKKNE